MTRDYVTLRLQFVRLQQDAERLADRLKVAARELRKSGGLTGAVDEHLSDFLHDWDTLDHDLLSNDAVVAHQNPKEPSRLSGLEEKLDVHQMHERARVIIRSVQRVRFNDGADSAALRNVHREMQVLEDSLDQPDTEHVLGQLVEGTHSANALLSLIRDGERLSDREWSELQRRVSDAYGTELATAVVRGRLTIGAPQRSDTSVPKLVFEEEKAPATETSNDALRLADSDGPTEGPSDDVTSGETTQRDAIFRGADEQFVAADDEGRTSDLFGNPETDAEPAVTPLVSESPRLMLHAEPPPDAEDDSIFEDSEDGNRSHGPALIINQSAEWQELTDAVTHRHASVDDAEGGSPDDNASAHRAAGVVALPKAYTPSEGPLQQAAQATLSDAALYRDRHVSDVILHLAAAGRLGLAAHVARGQEARGGLAVPFLPSWLLEAMTLAPHVTFVRGRLAAMIEESLSNCHERVWHDLSDEWKRGIGFFVRAATLRPSVVAPGTRAAAVLRSFALNSDCTELYNYCARTATFGERLQGLMPALFTHRHTHLSREDHLRALQAEVRQWSDVLADRTIAYAPAKQLFLHANWSVKAGSAVRHSLHIRRWQKWQQTLRLSEKIVRPVREGDSGLVREVKAEIRRLSSHLREGSWADSDGDTHSDGLIRLPHPAMRNVLREAMAYAQRWVGLHSSSAEEADFFLPQAAEELRAELLERHDGVVAELEHVRCQSQSSVERCGVTSLIRAVYELKEMVDPTGPVNPSEADPRHLLHAELLKIPGMRLDDRWEPQVDALTVQSRILRLLADPQPDWQTAFQTRCESGDRIATDRLLALDVWDSREQKDSLRELRDQYIQPTRASLMAELVQFERRLHVIANNERLADEQHEMEKRLQRLRDSLGSEAADAETLTTIAWCREEFAALKSSLRALQSGELSDSFPASTASDHGLPDDHLQH